MSDEDDDCARTPFAQSYSARMPSPMYTPKPPPEYGPLVILVRRGKWLGAPSGAPDDEAPLDTPAANVIFHWTGTERCKDMEECRRVARQIHRRHVEAGHGDLLYNFLVGDDGLVYEGLGWTRKSPMVTEVADQLRSSGVVIGLIGGRSECSADLGGEKSEIMKASVTSLMTTGILQKHLVEDHDILSLSDGKLHELPYHHEDEPKVA